MTRLSLVALILFSAAILPAEDAEPDLIPAFSAPRGFYRDPFELGISSPDPATIAFTLDGSDPRISPSAQRATTPFTVHIDPFDRGRRDRSPTVIVRGAIADNPTATVVTHTYLFVAEIRHLSPDGLAPGPLWAAPGTAGQYINYGLDLDILNDERYADRIEDAFLAIPTLSIATATSNLFGKETGIFLNAMQRGRDWERPVSLELLDPDGGESFQVNAGLRIRGGYSRHDHNPKHAFRLFFRSEYGDAKLTYPLFGDEGAARYDKMDLRTSQNFAWSCGKGPGYLNVMNRDVFSRDTQGDMGQPFTRSNYYHLYINGTYWGLFQTQERAEAAYAATYFGGAREDYDVVKVDASDSRYVIEATDGDLDSWRRVFELTQLGFESDQNYFRLQGRDPDGVRNPAYDIMVDLDNLIDYMLVIFYAGNYDAPVTKYLANKRPNNFFAIYDRRGEAGFRFFAHDAENALLHVPWDPGIGLEENRVNIGWLHGDERMTVSDFRNFHPQWLHHRLTAHSDYRTRFAEHVQRHFFDGGVLTPEANRARFLGRAAEIEVAIIAESARWGDAYAARARTQADWQRGIDHVVEDYFPARSDIVLRQLKNARLYPVLLRATLNLGDRPIEERVVKVARGTTITLENPNPTGEIAFTLDGSDPRLPGGLPSPTARVAPSPRAVEVHSTTMLRARIRGPKAAPAETLRILDEGLADRWYIRAPGTSDVSYESGRAYSGFTAAALSVEPESLNELWEVHIHTLTGVVGYRALSFAVHPGDARGKPTGALRISINGHPIGLARTHVDLNRPEWQRVVLSLRDFDLQTPFRMFTLSGNLTGTLYLDDVRLIPDASIPRSGPEAWSTLRERVLEVQTEVSGIRVSEIHYNPVGGDGFAGRDFEFIEIHNAGGEPLDLSLLTFADGIGYTFPSDTELAPGRFLVLAASGRAFAQRYASAPFGEFSGHLSNGGERLTLATASGDTILSFKYDDNRDWPADADGAGYSLVLLEDRGGDLSDGHSWRSSTSPHGSPGRADADTAVEESHAPPGGFALAQNYPNPFNTSTLIRFSLPAPGPASLRVYDLLGQQVAALLQEELPAGQHLCTWQPVDLASGIYLYRLEAGSLRTTRKLQLVR